MFSRRMMPLRLCLMATVLLVVTLTSGLGSYLVARGYNDYDTTSCRWSYSGGSSFRPKYRLGTYNTPTGIYLTAYTNARQSWNVTQTPVLWQQVTSQSTFRWEAAYFGLAGKLGYFFPGSCPNNIWAGGVTSLNRSELEGPWPDDWWKQYTATHELGHMLSLGHTQPNPNTLAAVMAGIPNQSPPYGWNSPTPDDQCGINSIYTSTVYPPTTPCGY